MKLFGKRSQARGKAEQDRSERERESDREAREAKRKVADQPPASPLPRPPEAKLRGSRSKAKPGEPLKKPWELEPEERGAGPKARQPKVGPPKVRKPKRSRGKDGAKEPAAAAKPAPVEKRQTHPPAPPPQRPDEPAPVAGGKPEARRSKRRQAGRRRADRPARRPGATTGPRAKTDGPKAHGRASAVGRRLSPALASARSGARSGLKATAGRISSEWPKVRRQAGRAGSRVAAVLKPVGVLALRGASLVERALRILGRAFRAATNFLARVITPERGVFVVVAAAAACLIISQYLNGRGVEIGQPQYAGLQGIVAPQQVDVRKAGEAHSYLLVPLAAIAIVLAAVALWTRRRQLGLAVGLIGLIGIAVSLLVDMPKGLDEGLANFRFSGAHATLEKGFYVQLAASAVLAMCGLLLTLELSGRRQPSARRRRIRRRRRRPRKAPSLARSSS